MPSCSAAYRYAEQWRRGRDGTGQIFIGAATDGLFRAIAIETGEVLWQDVLPAGGQANPISYSVGGRQYVAIFAGGHHFIETRIGDALAVYALPLE